MEKSNGILLFNKHKDHQQRQQICLKEHKQRQAKLPNHSCIPRVLRIAHKLWRAQQRSMQCSEVVTLHTRPLSQCFDGQHSSTNWAGL